MRLLYPWLALAAYLFFLAALATGFVLVAAVPLLVGGLAALLLVYGRVFAFFRLLRSFLTIIGGAFATAGRLLRDLFAGIFGGEPEPTGTLGSYGRDALPELFRLVDDVGAELGTRGVDRVYVTFDDNCGVIELRRSGLLPRRRARVLLLGIPYLYTLSLDELRTVLGHELAHLSAGLRARRATWRFLGRVEAQLERMREAGWTAINPLFGAVWIAHAILYDVNLRWSRADELLADRRAARALGANHAVAGLRRCRDSMPSLVVAMRYAGSWCAERRTAPVHLGEAAYRLAATMPPLLRKKVALWQATGDDVNDYADRTHPPIALRIAALRGIPDRPPRHQELAAKYLPDLRNMEAHLTRVVLEVSEQQPTRAIVEQILATQGREEAG